MVTENQQVIQTLSELLTGSSSPRCTGEVQVISGNAGCVAADLTLQEVKGTFPLNLRYSTSEGQGRLSRGEKSNASWPLKKLFIN